MRGEEYERNDKTEKTFRCSRVRDFRPLPYLRYLLARSPSIGLQPGKLPWWVLLFAIVTKDLQRPEVRLFDGANRPRIKHDE
jgi:hypothetical protein